MKKTSFTLIIALMAVAVLFTGCKKEELNGNGRKVTLGVRMEPGNAKSYIDGVTPKWHAHDQVMVNDGTYEVTGVDGNKAQIENVDEADNYRVVFPASIVTSEDISSTVNVTLPAVQTYTEVNGVQRVDAPMGGYGTSTDLSMHNLCSILKVNVTNTGNSPMILKKITVTAANALLSGTGTATVNGTNEDKINLTLGCTSVSLDFGGTEVIVPAMGGKTFYIVAPEFESQNVTISVFQEEWLSKKSYTNVTLEHNMITSVNVNNTNIIEDVLPGVFTVENGSHIYFSKGNLRAYNETANSTTGWVWSFHEHQYDYVGNNTANNAVGNNRVTTAGYVDLFGWVGVNSSLDAYGINNNNSDNNYGNTLGESLKRDWGEAMGGSWRTLTFLEWSYLINSRTTPSGVLYAKATVNGVNGLIILPDDWSTSYYTFNSPNTHNANYTTNTISLENWTSILEAHGAVFLPVTGYRYKNQVDNADSEARYWSATPYNSNANYMKVRDNIISTTSSSENRKYGHAVRLVLDYSN